MKRLASNAEFLPEDGYCILGTETLLKQIEELGKQLEGARKNDDIEYVHRLRVTSRRVRTALGLFEQCFSPKLAKKWRKALKNVTDSSGAARDADVQIAFLENYSTREDPNAAQGLQYLITLQKARRANMQSTLVRALDATTKSGILETISDDCKTITDAEDRSPNIKTVLAYEKAHEQISTRLNELLALEPFVHQEDAVAKHHELRIAAKRLRYTMEILSPLYRGGLRREISLMKQFQDVLGELHDYDVWIHDLSIEKLTIPEAARYGVTKLLTHFVETRKSSYKNFIYLWEDAVTNGLFNKIRKITATDPNSEIIRELLSRNNKVALISDIHGNLDALNAVIADAKLSGLELFLFAGDAVGFGIYPSQVVQTLRSAMFLNVIGNVDLEVLEALRNSREKDGSKEPAIRELSSSDVAYLQALPKELRLEIGNKKVLVTHGTPDSVNEHIYPDSPEERLKEIATKANADIIITGHSHMQMKRKVSEVTFVNPGSVGRPVDADPKAEYAILSFNPLAVEFRRVTYDVQAVADKMRKKRLSESHVQVLLRAVPLNVIKDQEECLKKKELWRKRSTVNNVRDIANRFLSDEPHAEQDRKLALMIFDKTKQLHSLGKEERYWLECAAILHDIGLSMSASGHHKSSLKLILNEPDLPFTHKERYLIGSIARYHRKALPNKNHFNLAPLSQTERDKIGVLSSILRVADALDYSHRSVVKSVNVKAFPNYIVLECLGGRSHDLEDQSVKKKKDLFERAFKKDLTIVWKTQQTPAKQKTSKAQLIT